MEDADNDDVHWSQWSAYQGPIGIEAGVPWSVLESLSKLLYSSLILATPE